MNRVVLHLSDPDYRLIDSAALRGFLSRGERLSIHINRGTTTEIVNFRQERGETTTETWFTDSSHNCGCP